MPSYIRMRKLNHIISACHACERWLRRSSASSGFHLAQSHSFIRLKDQVMAIKHLSEAIQLGVVSTSHCKPLASASRY